MKTETLKRITLNLGVSSAILIMALVPFHAFLTVWAGSIFGHYTAFRLWEEYLLIVCMLSATFLVITNPKIRGSIAKNKLFGLIILFLLVQVIWAVVAYHNKDVDKKALAYGLLLNCRYLIFFLVVWILSLKSSRLRDSSIKLILWPAAVVIIFGLLQIFILPRNFLSHFGYSLKTIPAYETINHNSRYIRIESTLRGANPLGAYLLIPLALLSVHLFRCKGYLKKSLFIFGGLVTLVFSFSRSAWIGEVLSMAASLFYSLKSRVLKIRMIYLGVIAVLLLAGLAFSLRNNTHFQNIVFHTQTHSSVKTTSDQGHSSALKSGLSNLAHEPLGRGPGTAGPASVYNNHPARIAENYFIQIGQETGWLGLGLFIAINAYVGYLLWLKRADNLCLALFASFLGICLVNMLSHAWSDETLSYLWWGLAAISLSSPLKSKAKSAR